MGRQLAPAGQPDWAVRPSTTFRDGAVRSAHTSCRGDSCMSGKRSARRNVQSLTDARQRKRYRGRGRHRCRVHPRGEDGRRRDPSGPGAQHRPPLAVHGCRRLLPAGDAQAEYLAGRAATRAAKEGERETLEVEALTEIRDALGRRGMASARTPPAGIRCGGVASRRGSGSDRRRCRRPEPARPTPGPCRPRTAGPADHRRREQAWAWSPAASAPAAAAASHLAVRRRGRYSCLQDTATLSGPSDRAATARGPRGTTGRGSRPPTKPFRCCPPSMRRSAPSAPRAARRPPS